MIEKGEVPALSSFKAASLRLAAKTFRYATSAFFILTCACVVNYIFRQNAKHWIFASAGCFAAAVSIYPALAKKLKRNTKLLLISVIFYKNQADDVKKRLESIGSYWNAKAWLIKEGPAQASDSNNPVKRERPKALDNIQGISRLEEADSAHNLDISWRYYLLQKAFYEAMADLTDKPIHRKRFDDIFTWNRPNLTAFHTLIIAAGRHRKPIEFLHIKNSFVNIEDEKQILSKVRDLGESCFKSCKFGEAPDTDLKNQFVELLKLLPTKT